MRQNPPHQRVMTLRSPFSSRAPAFQSISSNLLCSIKESLSLSLKLTLRLYSFTYHVIQCKQLCQCASNNVNPFYGGCKSIPQIHRYFMMFNWCRHTVWFLRGWLTSFKIRWYHFPYFSWAPPTNTRLGRDLKIQKKAKYIKYNNSINKKTHAISLYR